jgi:NADH-quinone oxidoreductase subunit J
MSFLFYSAAIIAAAASIAAVTRPHVVHALLYLIVSFLATALVMYSLGAPFIAALEIITYAGAIMVLFMFAIMLLNLGAFSIDQERKWQPAAAWIGPAILSALLLIEFMITFLSRPAVRAATLTISPQQVGTALFSTYLLGVELAAMLLLAGLVGAYYLGRQGHSSDNRKAAGDDTPI